MQAIRRLLLATCLLPGAAFAQYLVKDINASAINASSSPTSLASVVGGAFVFLAAQDGVNGVELWRTDGTTGGTVLVKDINAGSVSSNPTGFVTFLGKVYFAASEAASGSELWVSDGTAAGTVLVTDINPGAPGSAPASLTVIGAYLYFSAADATNGRELWRFDGATASLVKDIYSGTSNSNPANLVNLGGALVFAAADATGTELWKSDGTSAGTVQVKDINVTTTSASSSPALLVVLGGLVVFSASDGLSGTEIWASDGSAANTVMLKDIYAGTTASSPGPLVVSNGKVFFTANEAATGRELYTTDGTAANTQMVVDLYAGTSSGTTSTTTAMTAYLTGVVMYGATAATGNEVFFSDGTAAGTVLVKDIAQGTASSTPYPITNVNGVVYIQATDGTTGYEPFRTDGTAAGTYLLRDVYPGTSSSLATAFTPIGATKCVFTATDSSGVGNELWVSDGTVAGTQLLKDINTTGATPGTSSPTNFVSFNGKLFFTANDGVVGTELWTSDGTSLGTSLVKDINAGAAGSSPTSLVVVNGKLYFAATDGVNGTELWGSDGTTAGTAMVSDINPGASNSSPANFKNVLGVLFFSASTAANGTELWRSDGTAAGTSLILDVNPGTTSGVNTTASAFAVLGNLLYFTGNNGVNGSELWKSDGTGAGTVMVADIYPGASSGLPYPTYAWNGRIYTQATDGIAGYELWQSDGTVAGTVLLKDIYGGSTGSFPANFTGFGGTLIFAATDAAGGAELWKTDGTVAGTALVKDIYPGGSGSNPARMAVVGDRVFFYASDASSSGGELWMTDGTTANTALVKDIYAGTSTGLTGSFLYPLGAGKRMLFVANDGATGSEFWVSDGTAGGTTLLGELIAGPTGGAQTASAFAFVHELGIGFVVGNNGVTGNELFAFSAGQLGITEVEPIGANCKGYGDPLIGTTGAPYVGNAGFAVVLYGARPTVPAALVIAAARLDIQIGACTIYPSLIAPLVINTSTDAAGGASVNLAVPNTPALIGGPVFGQWAVADPGGPLFNVISLSNGLRLRIGGS